MELLIYQSFSKWNMFVQLSYLGGPTLYKSVYLKIWYV